MGVIDIFILIFAILLIIIVMLQESKDDINDAFSGQKTELFKDQKVRGIDLLFQRLTLAFAAIFFVLIIVAACL